MMCSANVGGDPVNGCENETVPGEDLCRKHLDQVQEATERPVETGHGAWSYKGWTFHRSALSDGFAIHGPNSTGRRARKVVHGWSDAVAYIDERA